MENVNFGAGAGEDIERALMDLGPLLGVTIKEEVPDEQSQQPAPANNAGTSSGSATPQPTGGGSATPAPGGKDDAADSADCAGAADARCVFCSQSLLATDGIPQLMGCLHSACEPCLKTKAEERQLNNNQRDFLGAERLTVTCPVCRLACSSQNMVEQRFVLEKLECEQAGNNVGPASQQGCSSCGDQQPATSYCVDCSDVICDSCVQAHQRLKITKDHTIKSREEAVAELQAAAAAARHAFCREHPQERLSLFCETCERLTCRDCQLQQHRDHRYQFSDEMAQQARATISSLLSEVSYKRVLLGSAMKVIRDRQRLIADKKRALVHDITSAVVRLTNAINTRGKQLVLRLNEVCDSKQRTLAEKRDALQQLADMTEHCVRFVGTALDTGSDTSLLHTKRAVVQHLQRIKSRRADIPNPEIPVRIALSMDKLPDLLKVLSTIGSIVVDGKMDGNNASPAPGNSNMPVGHNMASGNNSMTVNNNHLPPPYHQLNVHQQHQQHPQQSFVTSMGGALGGAMGGGMGGSNAFLAALQSRAQLRHTSPHVTSTTHPHHLQGMSEMNLRGLLNACGRGASPRAPAPHVGYPPMVPHYNNQAAYANSANAQGGRWGGNTPPAVTLAKWHIPQLAAGSMESGGGGAAAEVAYKIPLARPAHSVSSTNPKSPSPLPPAGAGAGAGGLESLDKVCAASVQDLMATIAKLDSNGVQVVAEPHVHSSTSPVEKTEATVGRETSADPNEDWCAVCMDGGELMCCDHCPKVFHQYCHLPHVSQLPSETESWQCLLCVNLSAAEGPQQRVMERVALELYCQYDASLPFRDRPPHADKVPRAVCLDEIRLRLQEGHPQRYWHPAQLVADVRLMLRHATTLHPVDSQIFKEGKRLEDFFNSLLEKFLPEYRYWNGEGEPPNKKPRLN